ncbi:repressible acid phosphatase [Coccidioides immitis RMSCC 3703]|uniref:Repressible acid phosphatase n=1 Tax=Coccidioides immitis RMSCC 3703 TaxID=454286 RepID=A0A0J8QTE1_COCIT|nr:repressible acid phosphatase [Coccidioides immitis RMSCC 3703]
MPAFQALFLFPAILVLLLALVFSPTIFVRQLYSSLCSVQSTTGSNRFSSTPYFPSWNSWWHQQSAGKRGIQSRPSGWNLLYHLGGNGPWIEKIDGILEVGASGIGPPQGCVVDGVHMMSRHAERYPTSSAGGRHLDLLSRIKAAGLMNGTLAFLNNWTYITQDSHGDFDQLISHGPYAGTLQAFTTGVRLRTRYSHLLSLRNHTRFWASDCKRVIDSARYFATGFFGSNWETKHIATLEVIPETADRAADTLTPGDTCIKYLDDPDHGHDKGLKMLAEFQEAYIPLISKRLIRENPNIKFTNSEIYSMQEMCGFEILTRGSSPWCDVFTLNDWEHFEYARDLLHYYRAGPGNPYGATMGWLWLNRTTELLLHPSNQGDMFFSFVHDGDIAPMLSALKIFDDTRDLTTTHIAGNRNWRTSQVMPMGGRIIFERLNCEPGEMKNLSDPRDSPEDDRASRFIRININDGIVTLPDCNSGPGGSCPLSNFAERTRVRGEGGG